MTPQSILAALRAECDAATPGPWVTERFDTDNGYIHFIVNDAEMQQVAFCHEDMHPKTYRKDAAFIASARTRLPLLIDALGVALEKLEFYGRMRTNNYEVEGDGARARNALASIAEILSRAKKEGGR